MVNRLVSVGDDFTLPAAVKAADVNLPAHAKAAALDAKYATIASVPPLVSAAIADDGTVVAAAADAVTADIAGRDLLESTDERVPQIKSAPGILASVVDAAGRMTDLTVRDTDGQLSDFVIERLAARLGPLLGVANITSGDKYVRGAELLPVLTDMERWAGWGSSSMDNFGWLLNELGGGTYGTTSVYQGGKGGEFAAQIAARIGSHPALVTLDGPIPASGFIGGTSSNMPAVTALRTYPGYFKGFPSVPGSISYDATTTALRFTRTTAGTATTIPAGTPFIPDAASYRDAVTFLWMGKNDFVYDTPGIEDYVIRMTDEAHDWLSPLVKKVIVLGHFVDTNTAANAPRRAQIYAANAAAKARYGDRFIDVHEYLTTNAVWAATGITPTATDLEQQALGNKPPSASSDDLHMSTPANQGLKALLSARLDSLNWY